MSTHLPFRLVRPLHRQCLEFSPSNRFFSSTSALAAPSGGRKNRPVDPVMAKAVVKKQQSKAPSALQEEQLADERNVPEDIGLIPGTFVHAPLFPLTRFSLSERMWYEWKWIRSRASAWFQLWRFRRSFTSTQPHVYWYKGRSTLSHKAVQKYRHLYEAFAKADSKAISQLCASGVAKEFQKRIDSRQSGVQMRWNLHGEPKCTIVSNIASPLSLPGYEETGIHQVTFRIRSNQTLTLGRGGKEDGSAKNSPDVVEYLVLQRQFVRGSAKEWKIWGFTDFSTPKSIEQGEEYAREVNAYQAV